MKHFKGLRQRLKVSITHSVLLTCDLNIKMYASYS